MAQSFVQYPADGTNYSVPFQYISKSHVIVSVDGAAVPFSWLSHSLVQLSIAPVNGAVVEVRRATPSLNRVVDFVDGSTLTEADLDKSALQFLFLSQEAQDLAVNTPKLVSDGSFDFNSRRAGNAADPVNPTDLVNKQWVENSSTSVLAQTITQAELASAFAYSAQAAKDAAVAAVGDFDVSLTMTGGSLELAAALNAKNIRIPSGTWNVPANVTVPRGLKLTFERGAQLNVASGATVTVRCLVDAPLARIFTGAGKVLGIADVRPEWWGAVGDGVVDDQPALQAAHDCVEASGASDGEGPVVRLRGGNTNYGLAKQLTLRPTLSCNLHFVGGGAVLGTRFTALASFSSSLGSAAIRIQGTADTIQQIAGYRVGNFSVSAATGTAAVVGVRVGGDGTAGVSGQRGLIGVQANQIHDVYVEKFAINWRVANCRLIDFNRCSGWTVGRSNVVGLLISVDAASAFTGDLNFNSCQFVIDLLDGTKAVSVSHSANAGQIKGVRFNDTIFYHGERFLEIYASNGAIIGDIWVNPGCQFDGFGNDSILIQADGTGSVIDDIHIRGSYFRGFTNGVQLRAKGTVGGIVASVMAHGNWYASMTSGAKVCVFEAGSTGCSFNFNTIQDIAETDNLIVLSSSKHNVIGNLLVQGAGGTSLVNYMVAVGVGVDYCVVSMNNSGGYAINGPVQNLSSASHNSLNVGNV